MKAISESRRGEGKYIRMPNVKHIVVCGTVRWEYLKQFLLEFYAEEANRRYRVSLMEPLEAFVARSRKDCAYWEAPFSIPVVFPLLRMSSTLCGFKVVVICNEPDWTTEVWTRFTSSLTIPPSNVKYFNGSTQTTRGLWSGDVRPSPEPMHVMLYLVHAVPAKVDGVVLATFSSHFPPHRSGHACRGGFCPCETSQCKSRERGL